MTTEPTAVLRVEQLTQSFRIRGSNRRVQALRGVDLTVVEGSSVGIVGESGSGKSTLGRAIVGLERPTGGTIEILGTDVLKRSSRQRLSIEGGVQMIFQDPRMSLNPRLPMWRCVAEPLLARKLPASRPVVDALLERVGLASRYGDMFAHQLSGGQCQRVAIALAVAARPKLIVADEPVSALDVSVQAQILNLLKDIQQEFETSFVFISHDLGVVRFFCDRVSVLYLGQVLESGPTQSVLTEPQHPYTEVLASASPTLQLAERKEQLLVAGEPPRPDQPPAGCSFHARCPRRIGPVCDDVPPESYPTDDGFARCHLRAPLPQPVIPLDKPTKEIA